MRHHRLVSSGLRWLTLVGLVIGMLGPRAWAQQQHDRDGASVWETLTNCRLIGDAATDGDSFRLRHRGRDYVFRLYAVDAAETSLRFPERNQAQAEAFDLPLTNTLRLGEAATRFTTQFLRRPSTVVTRWENGLGAGSQPRFYALVLIGRTNLAVELVRHGLARVYGRIPPWPAAAGEARLREELRAAEREARRSNRGAWSPEFRTTLAGPPPSNPRLDLNRATAEELTRLPGIGSTLAGRIIAARPFRSVGDLDRVPGIGPGKLVVLRDLVEVSRTDIRR